MWSEHVFVRFSNGGSEVNTSVLWYNLSSATCLMSPGISHTLNVRSVSACASWPIRTITVSSALCLILLKRLLFEKSFTDGVNRSSLNVTHPCLVFMEKHNRPNLLYFVPEVHRWSTGISKWSNYPKKAYWNTWTDDSSQKPVIYYCCFCQTKYLASFPSSLQ